MSVMTSHNKILIVDENVFSRVCSAILNNEGYQTILAVSTEEAIEYISNNGISLVVLSYPFALSFLKSEILNDIPTIVLSDKFNDELIDVTKRIRNSISLVKPLDFERFKYIVRGILSGYLNLSGSNIIA